MPGRGCVPVVESSIILSRISQDRKARSCLLAIRQWIHSGRQITDGAREVRILGQNYPVKAKIVKLNGFSSHADKDELLAWISALKRPPRQIFVVHGEETVS